MKILLSAYACEPDKGSEPGVGWHWALALARRGCDVHVITRSNNLSSIEQAVCGSDSRLAFHYYDLPGWLRFWKHWPGGIYLYYLLWQIGAYRVAKRLHRRESFDRVQHITFVSFRQPSFMGGLGIPFVFGPVGGGETMPVQLRKSLPLSARVAEVVRALGNRFAAIDPMMRRTYVAAERIVCTTEETRAAIPGRFRDKCIVQRAIGIDPASVRPGGAGPAFTAERGPKPQFLFVGRLLYWKGLHLALRALPAVRRVVADVNLRVIGEGDEGRWLKQVAARAGISECVEWIPRKPHNEIEKEYLQSMALIFPSLHDSGGMVVLEAMSSGVPVVCLNLGGPGAMVTPEAGFSLEVDQLSEAEVVAEIAAAMIRLATDQALRTSLSAGACHRAAELSWDAAADGVYGSRFMAKKAPPAQARDAGRQEQWDLRM
jgi:glycosyltransferase involved in cell wall biosynthesis